MALRLLHTDAELHRGLCPQEPIERTLFEWFEQIRVESLVPPDMPGAASNLLHRHERWSMAFHESGATESATGLLVYTALQMCRARVSSQPVLEATEGLIEATRMSLAGLLGHEIAGLRRHRTDQAAYACHALAIARTVAEMIRRAGEENGHDRPDDTEDDKNKRKAFTLWMDFDATEGDGFTTAASADSRVLAETEGGYRVFTTSHDRETRPGTQVRTVLLKEYRERLDRRIAAQGINVARLARELKALLAVPVRDGWDGSQEEGHIDGRRLAQLIATPAERRLFRIEQRAPVTDCLVSFLIDCSGSMKQHVEQVAMLVDVLARALEQAGASCEVLGFTTGAWNGGQARRDWQRAGRPRYPGRLNELCHLVFKDADTPWRRARSDIAALLKLDLFREGIDGEAVEWACRRMEGRSERRKLLIVVSDGCPMDSATNLANDEHYLDHHLREVVARRERDGAVEILGVGVGLDLSPYYRRSRALDMSTGMSNECFRELVALIGAAPRAPFARLTLL